MMASKWGLLVPVPTWMVDNSNAPISWDILPECRSELDAMVRMAEADLPSGYVLTKATVSRSTMEYHGELVYVFGMIREYEKGDEPHGTE
jgi:hypothetical protein